MRLLSKTFRSIKPSNFKASNPSSSSKPSSSASIPRSKSSSTSDSRSSFWCVYLILSTNTPIKTYVGVTNNFSRRLKQHNGEQKGGAKASHAGRPWICACIIQGFGDRSEACVFESKWKKSSRKLPREKKNDDTIKPSSSDDSNRLLQHREKALSRIKSSFDCSNLEINWQLNPF